MDGRHFDALTRSLGRRRLFPVIAGLGLTAAVSRPAAAKKTICKGLKCPVSQCETCEFNAAGSCSCWCNPCKHLQPGIAGGGAIRTGDGAEVQLSLVATRSDDPDQPGASIMLGQVTWHDPGWQETGLTLESVAIAFYGPQEGVKNGREVVGWMHADQAAGDHPFVLHAVDGGAPGSGRDIVTLWVGDAVRDDPRLAGAFDHLPAATGFRYTAQGSLIAGNLELISLGAPPAADTSAP